MSKGLCFRNGGRETSPTVPTPLAGYSDATDANTEVTRAGVTFQRSSGSDGGTNNNSSWESGDATEFDGRYFISGSGVARWRVVLSASGSYEVRVAHPLRSFLRSRVRIYNSDGTATLGSGTLLATYDASTAAIEADDPVDTGRYIDAAGTIRNFTVPLASSTPGAPVTVSGTTVWVELSTIAGSFNCFVAAVSLTSVDTGSITGDVTPTSATIIQGGTVSVPVTITRVAPFTGDVTVTPTGMTTGLTQTGTLVLGTGVTSGTLAFAATGSATIGAPTITATFSGSGVSDVTDTFTLSVTSPGASPTMSEGSVVIVQPVSPASPEPVPFVAISSSTGVELTSALGISVRYKKPGGAWGDKTAVYDGEPGCFTWAPNAGDVDTQGRGRFVIGGAAARVSYNVEIVGADQRQSLFRATWASLDSVGWSPLKYLRSVFSTSASFLSGAQTGTGQFRNPTDTTTWTQASWDGNGNRSAITFSAPNDP
jgi:hypothetical protein